MKYLILASRILAGSVFLFSGLVKAIDPMGTAYKFQDYFSAFDVGFLSGFGLPLAILLCAAEFFSGFSVLTGFSIRTGIKVMMLLMLVFTPLTLFIAFTSPVTDCGCFGDAIKLTNWQTFWKNLVLIIPVTLVFFSGKSLPESSPVKEWAYPGITLVFFFLFIIYNLRYLPVIDFLPYKTGINIADEMSIPEGAPVDRYETTFLYEKDGQVKEFDLSNYPAGDTAWKFIDQKSVLIEKGYEPPIHDFVLSSETGEDMTENILSFPGYTLFMIIKDIPGAQIDHVREGLEHGRYVMNNGMRFYVLTASGRNGTEEYETDTEIQFLTADETTLKTMVRSEPGYMLIRNGVIEGKWSRVNLPEKEWFGRLK